MITTRKKTPFFLSVVLILVATGAVSTYAYETHNNMSSHVAAAANSTDGFPRESSGGWTVSFVGDNPTPAGCDSLLGTTLNQGYTLKTYVSSGGVKAGGLVCVDIVLQNVNGTMVTDGTVDKIRWLGYQLVDSSGKVVDQFYCHPMPPPTGQGHAPSTPHTAFNCGAMWDTNVPNAAGVAPQPGTYHIIASASYPATSANSATNATAYGRADVAVLPK
jgi:hypothetical protein